MVVRKTAEQSTRRATKGQAGAPAPAAPAGRGPAADRGSGGTPGPTKTNKKAAAGKKQTAAPQPPTGRAPAPGRRGAMRAAAPRGSGGPAQPASGGAPGTAARSPGRAAGGSAARKAAAGPAGGNATQKASAARKEAAAEKTGAKPVVAKKTAARAAAPEASALPSARAAAEPADPASLAVRPGEEPWTPEEVEEARTGLLTEADRLKAEIAAAEESISGLMRDSGDGAGDDQADVGTKNISREHEMALADNARDVLQQTEHALERLANGTYGLCEVCGKPIGKARMLAFPRATLCVEDKQRQERR